MGYQNFSATGEEAGRLCSHTFVECTLVIAGTDETLKLPLQICTKVEAVRTALSAKLGYINPNEISFVIKQGCTFKTMLDQDQVARRMVVRGITSFKAGLHKYPHPYGIIGAGYNGIKTALFLEKDGQTDYVIFDRYDRVGGHAWLECANKTTRLQTEFSCYHLWYGSEWSTIDSTYCGGAPKDWELWPTRDRVLEHFDLCVQEFGILAHCRLNTDVEGVDMKGKPTDSDRFFNFSCVPKVCERTDIQGGRKAEVEEGVGADEEHSGDYAKTFRPDPMREAYVFTCSCFAIWPGNLINPRQLQYKGEELFGGFIDYGVEMRFDYNQVIGKTAIIHGHGAFTMENIRTCCEYGCKHLYVVCRRRNMTCPRVVSWFINQADPPITAVHCLNMLRVAYSLANFDPWDMHSVSTNPNRTHATLNQTTRFGIGDIYFLAAAYGVMEIVTDNIKRCTYRTVHLESGKKLEGIDVILKCLGMLPDWSVDKVVRAKFLKGFWINGDSRRFTCADPNGIAASNFSATTVGPGSYGWCKLMKHFWDVPNDWAQLEEAGHLGMLPIHNAGEPEPDTPAYFLDARHAASTMITMTTLSPLFQEKTATDGAYKKWVVHYCSPPERFLEACKQEWDAYERMFRDKGMVPEDASYIPYPYTLEYIQEQQEVHLQDMLRQAERRGRP